MLIRDAGAADNDALLALAGTISLPGPVRFGVDRAPDFFALDRLLGTPCALLAEEDGRAVAFADAAILDVRVAHRIVRAAYVSLAGVAAGFRESGSVRDLLRELEARLRGAGCELAIAVINARNARARTFFERRVVGGIAGRPLVLNVLLGARRVRDREVALRRACPRDLARIEALVAADRARYDVSVAAPLPVEGTPGALAPGDFRLAEDRHGNIVACLALWDQGAWRRTPALGYGSWMRLARIALDALARTGERPRLPRPGEPFRFAHVAFASAAPGAEAAFGALLRESAREMATRGWHFLAFAAPADDPLLGAVCGCVRLTSSSVPYLAPDEALRPLLLGLGEPRVRLEYALV